MLCVFVWHFRLSHWSFLCRDGTMNRLQENNQQPVLIHLHIPFMVSLTKIYEDKYCRHLSEQILRSRSLTADVAIQMTCSVIHAIVSGSFKIGLFFCVACSCSAAGIQYFYSMWQVYGYTGSLSPTDIAILGNQSHSLWRWSEGVRAFLEIRTHDFLSFMTRLTILEVSKRQSTNVGWKWGRCCRVTLRATEER